MPRKKPALIVLLAAAAVGITFYARQPVEAERSGAAMAEVALPAISGLAAEGKTAFDLRCASCHGANAAGQEGAAPPLVHRIYEPGHHGDIAFVMAAKQGVRQHHWPFGNMPPVAGITDAEITAIIAYVRALQKHNGIF